MIDRPTSDPQPPTTLQIWAQLTTEFKAEGINLKNTNSYELLLCYLIQDNIQRKKLLQEAWSEGKFPARFSLDLLSIVMGYLSINIKDSLDQPAEQLTQRFTTTTDWDMTQGSSQLFFNCHITPVISCLSVYASDLPPAHVSDTHEDGVTLQVDNTAIRHPGLISDLKDTLKLKLQPSVHECLLKLQEISTALGNTDFTQALRLRINNLCVELSKVDNNVERINQLIWHVRNQRKICGTLRKQLIINMFDSPTQYSRLDESLAQVKTTLDKLDSNFNKRSLQVVEEQQKHSRKRKIHSK